jgi:hypothetical protein
MTIAKSDTNTPEARLIYESPDRGKTVYAREVGSDKRYLVKQDEEVVQREKTAIRANRLLTILKLSETDTTLRDALAQLEVLYIVKYGDDKDN